MNDSLPSLPSRGSKRWRSIALLIFDGIGPFHLSGPLLVFGNNGINKPPVDLLMCASSPGLLRTLAGFEMAAPYGLEKLADADVIIIPGWQDIDAPVPEALKVELRRAHVREAQIVGLCLGTFVLAEAGLLDGRRATTHWLRAEAFNRRFPGVRLQTDILYARDGNVWTSAGGAAAIDLCLHLMREIHGPAAAEQTARCIVSAPQRQGEQQQRVDRPLPVSDNDKRLLQVMEQIRANLHEAQRVTDVAARMNMSVRTFTRRFREIVGTSFLQWLLDQRLAYAQLLLEGSDCTMEIIAAKAGFSSSLALRKHFRQAVGLSPKEYRKSLAL